MSGGLRRTPLHARHLELGARMGSFAGWELPLWYDSIVREHLAVRAAAGLFDVSHMGTLALVGPGAAAAAARLFTNLRRPRPGRVRYGFFCDERGGVVDDATCTLLGDGTVLFCVNAARREAVRAWCGRWLSGRRDVRLEDRSDATALLALQGPRAAAILASRAADPDALPPRWHAAPARVAGVPALVSRTGYTGEDGFELYLPAERATTAWDALLEGGAVPAGLGARDTLRIEAGLPLYGHELSIERTPIEAGLERFLAFGQGFLGEEALRERLARGPRERRVGLVLEGRAVARAGAPVRTPAGAGVVTSGTWGPSVERSIAMGYVPAPAAGPGTPATVEIRGRAVAATVVALPFYARGGGA